MEGQIMSTKSSNADCAKHVRKHRVSESFNDSAIFNFFSALDCPRSLTCWLLYKHKEHRQLVDLDVLPIRYSDGKKFRDDYIATCFLSKADFLDIGQSKKQAAMDKFSKFEDLCRCTNDRFRPSSSQLLTSAENVWLLNATKRKIAMILGDYSPEEFVEGANWGPGVSTLLKGEHVSAYNKFQSETGITRDLYSFVRDWFPLAYPLCASHLRGENPGTENDGFTFEVGNVIITVPKNSKTDRVIAVEPGWNLFFQKSLGSMIRRRLQRHGVNLNSQDKNQQFAHEGAFMDHLATVDFSSASDSVSTNIVRELIPPRWFLLLDVTRSKIGRDGSSLVRWNKFSSMGNGFTFELESLIFFAAALAVCDFQGIHSLDVSVYGDDVIIPTEVFPLYSSFCAYLGFVVNPGKSFYQGPFRESCGAHYFEALDCKPLYLKGRLRNVQAIYKLANGIRLLAHRYGSNRSCDRRFRSCWLSVRRGVPKPLRFSIPYGIGDGGFVSNFDEAAPPIVRRDHRTWEGFDVVSVLEIGVTQYCEGPGLLMDRVRGRQELALGNAYVLRDRTKISIQRVFVRSWYNLGGWSNHS
jgi:hypothetical protein